MIDFLKRRGTYLFFWFSTLVVTYLLMIFIGGDLIGARFYMGFLFFISMPFLAFLILEEVQYKRLMKKLEDLEYSIKTLGMGEVEGDLYFLNAKSRALYQSFGSIILTLQRLYLESRMKFKRHKEGYPQWVHDIKIPLASLLLLRHNYEKDLPEDFIVELNLAVLQMDSLLEQQLYMEKIDYLNRDFMIDYYPLKPIVNQVIKKNHLLFLQKKMHLSIEIDDIKVLTDEKWLKYIIAQLIVNSIKYTPMGGSISIKEWHDHGFVFLSVKDNGEGIKTEEIPRVFEYGFTGFNGRKEKASSGLGLYLAKEMCGHLDHDIWVDTVLQEGTCFTIKMKKA